jgi:hypothetical protein
MNYLDLLLASPVWPLLKAAAELGLLVFAATQVLLHHREHRTRQQAAFGVVYADFVRLLAKQADWEGADLVQMAAAGRLYYDDIASADSGAVASSLGGLSVGGLALCSHAYALLSQAVDTARLLADSKGATVGAMTGQEVADHCKATLAEVVLTLEDAIAEIPKDVQALRIANPNPKSSAGKGFRGVYVERQREEQEPTSGFWATRTGRILSATGRAIQP